jgi:hypothetical protein
MKDRGFQQTEKKKIFFPPGGSATSGRHQRRMIAFTRFVALILLLVIAPPNLYPQAMLFSNVKDVVKDVQRQFRLNSEEIQELKPLILEENADVFRIYSRYGLRDPEFSTEIWREIIQRRMDFEKRLGARLSGRQKAALRSVRTMLEGRVIGFWAEDYAMFLGEFLELEALEAELIQFILSEEYAERHRLIVKHIGHPVILQQKMENVYWETERKLKLILSPAQFRDYRTLVETEKPLVGRLRNKQIRPDKAVC